MYGSIHGCKGTVEGKNLAPLEPVGYRPWGVARGRQNHVNLSIGASAQDKVTLSNGDVLTGKITSMADGKVTIKSPLLADVVVPIESVSDIVTNESVTLKTKNGDLWQRRIIGIEGGNLRLEGGATSSLA